MLVKLVQRTLTCQYPWISDLMLDIVGLVVENRARISLGWTDISRSLPTQCRKNFSEFSFRVSCLANLIGIILLVLFLGNKNMSFSKFAGNCELRTWINMYSLGRIFLTSIEVIELLTNLWLLCPIFSSSVSVSIIFLPSTSENSNPSCTKIFSRFLIGCSPLEIIS